jgi:CheY-like chemotaxis protein
MPNEKEQKPSATPNAASPAVGSAKKVLLIDDEPTTLKLTKEILIRSGYKVTSAKTGKAAWLTMTEDNMPDLIITDIMMPEMDGFAFLKQLKSNPETKNIPTLIISGRKQMEDTVLWAGADAFVLKPFTNEAFLLAVRKTLSTGGAFKI